MTRAFWGAVNGWERGEGEGVSALQDCFHLRGENIKTCAEKRFMEPNTLYPQFILWKIGERSLSLPLRPLHGRAQQPRCTQFFLPTDWPQTYIYSTGCCVSGLRGYFRFEKQAANAEKHGFCFDPSKEKLKTIFFFCLNYAGRL